MFRRAGAAAFVLGLLAAAPHGVAAADSGDVEATSVAGRSAKAATRLEKTDRVPAARTASRPQVRPAAPRAARRSVTPDAVAPVRRSAVVAVSVPAPAAAAAAPALPSRREAVSAGPAAPAPVQAAAGAVAFDPRQAIAQVNATIAGLFDATSNWLSGLPASPVTEVLSGALLLLRRNLFDQAPTAAPVQTTPYRSHGQILGTLGAADAEGDPLTYEVIEQPTYGTATVDAEGHYTYTPGPDFAGSLTPDTFTVRVTDANGGFNVLDPLGTRSIDVVVDAPDPDTPFFDGNNDDVAVFLSDAAARIAVTRQGATLLGSVSLDIPADTALRWLDENGRNGTVSVAEVASDWTKITDAGQARLGISYTAGGVEYTAILDSVQAAAGAGGGYVFSGELAPDVHDGDGLDCYYDVIGGAYKSEYESFLAAVSAADAFQADVTGAKVFLDTWSVSDYADELESAATGVSTAFPFAAVAAGPNLQDAVQFARNGIGLGGPADPVFSLAQFAPACKSTGTCTGTFYYESLATADLITAAQGSFSYDGRSVDVAFDFGGAAYGYVYVPDGVWDKLDYDMYSAGVFVAATAGPSLTLNLGADGGNFALASQRLPQAQYYNATPYGTIAVTGDLTASLDAKLGLPAGAKSLSANLLGTATAVITYNTGGVPGFQWGGSEFVVNSDFSDLAAISGASLTLTLNPAVTAAWGLFTPDSTPILGRVSFLEVGLGYTNSQLSATLNLADSSALTLNSTGSLGFSAALIPSLTDELTYTDSLSLDYTSANLLAL